MRLFSLVSCAAALSGCLTTQGENQSPEVAPPAAAVNPVSHLNPAQVSDANVGRLCATPFECATLAVKASEDAKLAAQTALKPLKGAVVAFNKTACPVGWTEYTLARGRFIRGIDNGNPSTDPDGRRAPGSVQDQMIGDHKHQITSQFGQADSGGGFEGQMFASNSNDAAGRGGAFPTQGVTAGGGSETRPKNVALLYCELQ